VTVGPENCPQLAQRNMQVTFSGNPSSADSRTIPQTFDLRPSPAVAATAGQLLDYPDELMIDWGNTPVGTVASIYWPQVQCIDVVRMAARLYGTNDLSLSDENTLQCTVNGGVSYVPIPSGVSQRLASLLTLVLPDGVVAKGQEFNIVVRRISSRQIQSVVIDAVKRSKARKPTTVQRNWRYVVGTFQVKVPVVAERDLRVPEENTYAILLWRFNQLSPVSRWWPVMKRYLDQVAARVTAFGGNPKQILPSPTGVPPSSGSGSGHGHGSGSGSGSSSGHGSGSGSGSGHGHGKDIHFTGKVVGLVFDRFGEFEGFILDTEHGEHEFSTMERDVQDLVERVWRERLRITVVTRSGHPHRPVSIMIRDLPAYP
jgi:uncharacterized membrane protein YgcG